MIKFSLSPVIYKAILQESISKSALIDKNPILKVLINNSTKLYLCRLAKSYIIMLRNHGIIGDRYYPHTVKYSYYYGIDPDSPVKLIEDNFIEVLSSNYERSSRNCRKNKGQHCYVF